MEMSSLFSKSGKGGVDEGEDAPKFPPNLLQQNSGTTELDDAVIRTELEPKKLSLIHPRRLFVETSWSEDFGSQTSRRLSLYSLESHSPVVLTHTLFCHGQVVKPISLIERIKLTSQDEVHFPAVDDDQQFAPKPVKKEKLPLHRRSFVGLIRDLWLYMKQTTAPIHNNKISPYAE